MGDSLASELLHEIKAESKRRFILLIICISLLFLSNLAWLIAWNLPSDEVTETYDLQGEDNANVFYNGEGEVSINGTERQDNNNEDESYTDTQTEK